MKSRVSLFLFLLWLATAIVAGLAFKKYLEVRKLQPAREAEVKGDVQHALRPEPSAQVTPSDVLSRGEKLELMRLRNEITQLRSSNQALSKVEGENARLLAELKKLRAQSASSSEKRPGVERDQWSFQGYATPEAAYMSAMWALKEGRMDVVLASFTEEERQRFETDNQGKSREQIADAMKKEIGFVAALHIAGQRQVSPTEVILDTQITLPLTSTSPRGSVSQAVRMRLVGNEWKTADPIDRHTYDPLAFYRKNPELMKRYFPHLFKEGASDQGAAQAMSQRYGIPPRTPTPEN